MLERETELIKQIIIESTINGRPAIRLNDVVSSHLPRGVKAFMATAVVNLLEADFKQSSKLSQITRGISPTVTGERSLLQSLAMEYVLQQDEYLKLVEDAVHFLENYLCRPQWTLCELVFEKQERVSFGSLVRKFESVVDYAYFGTLVERHARRKNLAEIEIGQFKHLIGKIDEEIVKRHAPRELALLTKPIFDFLLFGDFSMARPVPLGAVLLFFDDKKMTAVKEYVERICHVRSRTQISMNELIGILEDHYQVESAVREEVKESEQEILNTVSPADQSTETKAKPAHDTASEPSSASSAGGATEGTTEPQSPDPAVPVSMPGDERPNVDVTILSTSELEKDIPNPKRPQPSPVHAADLVAFAAERDAQRFASYLTFPDRHSNGNSGEALPDLNEMLTEEQRERFVKRIFENDENACFIFLTSLNHARSWPEAQPFLRHLFEMNALDMQSTEVVEFTDAMQARFNPELRKAE